MADLPRTPQSLVAPFFQAHMLLLYREKNMLTEKQLAANRANAQHSTGPKTEEGKQRSRLNASRHNLTGQVTAMTPEDRAAHDAFSAGLIKSMAPEGELELQLAQRVATDSWRLNRASAIEDNIFALGLFRGPNDLDIEQAELHAAITAARTFTREAKTIELLTLYEQRLNRSIQKNLATLQALQTTRKAGQKAAMEEAARLLELSEIKGLPYEPTENGFVFSITQLRAQIDRKRRLAELEKLQKTHPNQTQAA
jgi:hypothetical protein